MYIAPINGKDVGKSHTVCKINFAHAVKIIMMCLCQITDGRNFVELLIRTGH
jgi:hypothetical protein